MAFPRRPVPKQSDEAIRVRMRMKPVDWTEVKAPRAYKKQWHLKWVANRALCIARARAKGYDFVPKGEVEVPAAYGDQSDNYIHHVDTILMKCPRELYDQRMKDADIFHEAQLRGRMEGMQEQAAQDGIKLEQKLTIGKPSRIGEESQEDQVVIETES